MLIFNITFNVESRISEQWIKWMKTNFIPVALETKLPKEIKVLKLLNEQENEDRTFAFQLHFKSMEDFMATANSVSNRRKSRAGRSLELHLEKIFTENGVTNFSNTGFIVQSS